MEVPIWVHHLEQYLSARVGSDDTALPMSEVWIKSSDVTSWMARYDRGLSRVPSPDDLRAGYVPWPEDRIAVHDAAALERIAAEIYRPQGIVARPWFVAAGRQRVAGTLTRSVAAVEGRMAAEASAVNVARVAILDLEPANHGPFWRDDLKAGPAEARALVEAFVANGGRELWIAPDARPLWLEPVAFDTWAGLPAVTRVLPQVYWRMFQKSPEAALAVAVRELEAHGWTKGLQSIHPILDGTAPPDEMEQAIRECYRLGLGSPSIYQRANLGVDTAGAVLNMDDPWAGKPALVGVNVARVRAMLDQMEAGVLEASSGLSEIKRQLAGIRSELG